MTLTQANEIINKSTRCTQATLAAFGVDGYPLQGSGCLGYLTDAGYTVELKWELKISLKDWYVKYMDMSKNYLIFTSGHAMACIGGVLVDAAAQGFNGRRIEQVFEVSGGLK